MSTRSGIIALSAVALILGTDSTWADSKSIQGTVIGLDGKPLAGADVRAERLDAKAEPARTKTDGKGQYQFKGLPVGAYAITTIVKEVPKSRASVRTRADGWAIRSRASSRTTRRRRRTWFSASDWDAAA